MFNKMNKYTIKVDRMVCEGCAQRVKNALMNAGKAQKVKIDLENKTVHIYSKDELSFSNIKSIIEDLGYEVLSVEFE